MPSGATTATAVWPPSSIDNGHRPDVSGTAASCRGPFVRVCLVRCAGILRLGFPHPAAAHPLPLAAYAGLPHKYIITLSCGRVGMQPAGHACGPSTGTAFRKHSLFGDEACGPPGSCRDQFTANYRTLARASGAIFFGNRSFFGPQPAEESIFRCGPPLGEASARPAQRAGNYIPECFRAVCPGF